MVIAIAAMVVAWGLVMLQRHEIRARWWEYKLVHSETLADRAKYLALLAGRDGRVGRSAERLLRHADAEIRSYGLALLNHVADELALPLLGQAAADAEADIREQAIARLATIGSPEGIDALIAIVAGDGSTAVRVQAIQCLGDLEAEQAVAVLTSCLDDDTVFEGMTAAERSAAAALESVQPDALVEWPEARTMADFAAAALERITGEPQPTTQSAGDNP
jgi:HEAT repeat protein